MSEHAAPARVRQTAAPQQRWPTLGPRPNTMPGNARARSSMSAIAGADLTGVRTHTPVLRTPPLLQRATDDGADNSRRGAVEEAAIPEGASPEESPDAPAAKGSSLLAAARECVNPVSVQNGPGHEPIDTTEQVGMEIDITVVPSSGGKEALLGVLDSEKVSSAVDPTGSFAGFAGTPSKTSDWMAARKVTVDEHMLPKDLFIDRVDNHGGDGSISYLQLDVYMNAYRKCRVKKPTVIPDSGYRITHTITSGPDTRISVRTEKSAEAVTVDGFTANAGPSPTYHDDNEVRA